MDPYLAEWINLLVRVLHVVAAIAWIGASFYFIAGGERLVVIIPAHWDLVAAKQAGTEPDPKPALRAKQ